MKNKILDSSQFFLYPIDLSIKNEKDENVFADILKTYTVWYYRGIFWLLLLKNEEDDGACAVMHEMFRDWRKKDKNLSFYKTFNDGIGNLERYHSFVRYDKTFDRNNISDAIPFYKFYFHHSAPSMLFGSVLSLSDSFLHSIYDEIGDFYIFVHDENSFYIAKKKEFDQKNCEPWQSFNDAMLILYPKEMSLTDTACCLTNFVGLYNGKEVEEYYPPVRTKEEILRDIEKNVGYFSASAYQSGYEQGEREIIYNQKIYFACLLLYTTNQKVKEIAEKTKLPLNETEMMAEKIRGN